ncbi:MAG: glycosyltransferase family 39 protein [Burkholderiales bacterium]|nr:glycosyltransferase family 39 protein [Bacteroidia bacterium]
MIFGILIIKCLACYAYYWVYFCYYPSGFNGDSVSTLHDAKIIYNALPKHVPDFFKMIFGLHSEMDTDSLYDPYFKHIEKWGRADVTSDFFLNDNRTPIRLNALIMLFSFGQYAVHALVMLILSFIGQYAFYKTFKKYFPKKEIILAAIIFLTPSILFWTSGVLKEPIAICLLGLFTYSFVKLFIHRQFKFKYFLLFATSVFFFMIIKPYIIALLIIPLILFVIVKHYRIKRVMLFYAGSMVLIYGIGIVTLKFVFNKDVLNTIVVRQNDFVSLSKGGIFFMRGEKYIRLEYKDSTHYKRVDTVNNLYQLDRHSAFMYWDTHNLRDTIYETNNKDTSYFSLEATCAPSGSAINIDRLQYSFSSFVKLIPQSFYNVLCKPFFYDSRSVLELMASAENLGILLFFIFCFVFKEKAFIDHNLLICFISIIIISFILIGITTTVTGAIVRYKVPFIPFLLMIPLLYLNPGILKKIPFIKHLVK